MRTITIFTAGILTGGAIIAAIAFKNGAVSTGGLQPAAGIDTGGTGAAATAETAAWEYRWHAPKLPSTIDFAGETTPLDRWEVRERLDRELLVNSYLHGSTLYILKLANRIFPVLEERLKANGIPEDFKYLCVAESALQNQRSPAGALGYWQFLNSTGKEHGLEITDQVDERYHLEKSTDAAAEYLKNAYERFGSWTAAAASYNCGMGGYQRFSSHQQSRNYYDLLLPEETNRYIFRILALKYILENPERMGFIAGETDVYQPIPTREVIVDKTLPSLVDFAKSQGTSYKILKTLNPWLRAHSLTVRPGHSYAIQVPL
ncbi:transglycosylase-like protein with SLT domain [Anseongella ginsenosidimutans]|uniref:Transglycosylase-like protein with SLT domain n=1 Tax=Anseongella ginsenosidimutans TaxID=496056 RepID=A0A4R3KU37_9SPHI|nr:lytic transglycosylase domain-containing protein [Anseongella ginsenosidimutans]QEC51554.1 lytic transglycosylase domain-containing protein [Anseongella ginsenosidimutans]TCS88879.1 transglycosylase-like protein with SLT domain [Anseongella ginsenosidimutans]